MAVRKPSLSLLSTESDSEELPTFTFLKKEPSSADRNQPQRENVVVVTSDSETSCPPSPGLKESPFVPHTAEAPTQAGPVRVLSSESEDEDVFVPLAQRITSKFLTHKPLSPEHSSFSLKTVSDHQNNTSGPCDWKKQPCPEIPDVPLHNALEKSPANDWDSVLDSPGRQLPAYQSTCSELVVTKTIPDIPLPQKRTKHNQKVQRRGSQGCWQPRQASRKENTPRQHEKRKKAVVVNRLKAQRPEECLKHIVVVLDPGSPRSQLPPEPSCLCPRLSDDHPFQSIAVLLQMEGGGQLLGALQSMECSCVIEAQAVPQSITWRRRTELAEVRASGWRFSFPFTL